MTRAQLTALAERVMALTGHCRLHDGRIEFALHGQKGRLRFDPDLRGLVARNDCPHYTLSLDDARSLIPPAPDHWPQVVMTGTNPNNPSKERERVEIWVKGKRKPVRSNAATPALALTAAALLARAAECEE